MTWPAAAEGEGEADRPVQIAAIEKFVRIFATTVPAFLPREKPISRNAKPACMNMTSSAATITHIELMPTSRAAAVAGGVERVGRAPPPGRSSGQRPEQPARTSDVRLIVLLVGVRLAVCGPGGPGSLAPCRKIGAAVSPSGRAGRPAQQGELRPRGRIGAPRERRTSAGHACAPCDLEEDARRHAHAPASRTSPPPSGAANGGALGPGGPDRARRLRLRRERLLDRRPAPAAAQGRLQAAAGDARPRRAARPVARRRGRRGDEASGRWRRARRTTRTGSSR